jgi:hypothetical protein
MRANRIYLIAAVLLTTVPGVLLIRERQENDRLKAAAAHDQEMLARLRGETHRLESRVIASESRLGGERAHVKRDSSPSDVQANASSSPSSGGEKRQLVSDRAVQSVRAIDPKRLSRMQSRYQAFFDQRGLSADEQREFIDLLVQQAEARADLQAAAREIGVAGGTKGIEALRSEAYAPIVSRMQELLGNDGYSAFGDYEKTSFYRTAFLDRVTPLLNAANASLSPAQSEQLVRIIAANDHPQRRNATDLGTESRVDWVAVADGAGKLLTPTQVKVLKQFAAQSEP